jgi:predicted nucleotidyltransferase
VLTALALAEESFTTGQLVRLLGHGSEEGIRKVLRRLTDQGVVTADRVGATFSYRLNRSHLAAEHIVGLANLRGALFRKIEQLLGSWPQPPVYAAVFGSAARSEMRVDSDIDIFLVRDDSSDDAAWLSQVDELVRTVTAWTGNDTRPLEYSVSELDTARAEPVLADIVDTGVTVAGQRTWLNARLRQQKG